MLTVTCPSFGAFYLNSQHIVVLSLSLGLNYLKGPGSDWEANQSWSATVLYFVSIYVAVSNSFQKK